MLVNITLLHCCQCTQTSNNYLTALKDTAPLVVPIIVVFIAAWLTYKYSINKLKKETDIALQKELYAKRLEACQNLWKLLAYTARTENPKTVLILNRSKTGEDTWYFNKTNAKAYINALADTFYGMGSGVFINNTAIKEKLFEYRSIVFGMLLKEANNTNDVIAVKNLEAKNRLLTLHDSLLKLLKDEVQKQGTLNEEMKNSI